MLVCIRSAAYLTIGEVYPVSKIIDAGDDTEILVKNDEGKWEYYFWDTFIPEEIINKKD